MTGFPVIPGGAAVASSVFGPMLGPRVQLPTVATPSGFVVWSGPVRLPPPPPTMKVTSTPDTGLPNRSVTRAPGGMVTSELGPVV